MYQPSTLIFAAFCDALNVDRRLFSATNKMLKKDQKKFKETFSRSERGEKTKRNVEEEDEVLMFEWPRSVRYDKFIAKSFLYQFTWNIVFVVDFFVILISHWINDPKQFSTGHCVARVVVDRDSQTEDEDGNNVERFLASHHKCFDINARSKVPSNESENFLQWCEKIRDFLKLPLPEVKSSGANWEAH